MPALDAALLCSFRSGYSLAKWFTMPVHLVPYINIFAGFEPRLADDTSYEADALPTKPPGLVQCLRHLNCKKYNRHLLIKGQFWPLIEWYLNCGINCLLFKKIIQIPLELFAIRWLDALIPFRYRTSLFFRSLIGSGLRIFIIWVPAWKSSRYYEHNSFQLAGRTLCN